MRAQVIKLGGGALLAVVLAIAVPGGASAVTLPDGEWEGRWYPGGSCRDTRERRVTARTEGGRIHGQVHNPPADPGIFVADVKPSGSFSSTVHGLKRRGFSVKGRASASEIKANWEGRDDCGTGNFVLRPLRGDADVTKLEAAPPESTEETPEAAAVQPDPGPPQTEAPAGQPDAARAALETLFQQGVITEEEYQAKLNALEPEAPAMMMAPSDLPPPDPRLVELDDLLTSGEISADEYLRRRTAITGDGN